MRNGLGGGRDDGGGCCGIVGIEIEIGIEIGRDGGEGEGEGCGGDGGRRRLGLVIVRVGVACFMLRLDSVMGLSEGMPGRGYKHVVRGISFR